MGWWMSTLIMYIHCLPLAISSTSSTPQKQLFSSSAPKTHQPVIAFGKKLGPGKQSEAHPINNQKDGPVTQTTNTNNQKNLAAKIWGRIKHDEIWWVCTCFAWGLTWPVTRPKCILFFSGSQVQLAKLWTTLMCNPGLENVHPHVASGRLFRGGLPVNLLSGDVHRAPTHQMFKHTVHCKISLACCSIDDATKIEVELPRSECILIEHIWTPLAEKKYRRIQHAVFKAKSQISTGGSLHGTYSCLSCLGSVVNRFAQAGHDQHQSLSCIKDTASVLPPTISSHMLCENNVHKAI